MSKQLKYGARLQRSLSDKRWCVVDESGKWWFCVPGLWREYCGNGWTLSKDQAIDDYERNGTPPPTYTAPHVEVKPDPWPSMMAKVSDAMHRLCDAAEQMKKERDAAIAERDAASAEVARLKEERK